MRRQLSKFISRTLIPQSHSPRRFDFGLECFSQIQLISLIISNISLFLADKNHDSFQAGLYRLAQPVTYDQGFINAFGSHVKNLLEVISIIYTIIIFVLVGLTIAIQFCLTKKFYKIVSELSQYAISLHLNVFFVPIINILGYSLTDSTTSSTKEGFISVLIVICILYALLGSFFSFQPLRRTFNSRKASPVILIDVVNKVIFFIGQISQHNHPQFGKWLCATLPIVLFAFRQVVVYIQLPFYRVGMYKVGVIFNSIQLSGTILNLFFCVFSLDNLSLPLIWCVWSPLLAKYRYDLCKNMFYDSIDKNAKDKNQQYRRLLMIFELFENVPLSLHLDRNANKNLNEQYFWSVIKRHNNKCMQENCICNVLLGNHENIKKSEIANQEKLKNEFADFRYKFFKELFEELLKSNSKGVEWIKILFAQLIIEQEPREYAIALSLLHSIAPKSGNIMVDYCVKNLIDEIHRFMMNMDTGVDIRGFVNYQNDAMKFQNMILNVTMETFKFWDKFQQPEPKYIEIFNQANIVNMQGAAIEKEWTIFIEKHGKRVRKEYLAYALYNSIVRNSEKTTFKAYSSYQKIMSREQQDETEQEKITNETLCDPENIAVVISMNKQKLGKIIYTSDNISDKYIWKSDELRGADVGVLMPPFIQARHTKYLQNYIDQGKSFDDLGKNNFDCSKLKFGTNKAGYLVPQYIHLSPHPVIDKEFSYVGIMRPLKTSDDYILLSEDHSILGVTEKICLDLNLNPTDYKRKIMDVCPEYESLNQILSFISELQKTNPQYFDKDKQWFTEENLMRIANFRLSNDNLSDYKQIIDCYEQLTSSGCYLEFVPTTKNLQERVKISYVCRIDELTFSDKPPNRVLILKKLGQKKIDNNLNSFSQMEAKAIIPNFVKIATKMDDSYLSVNEFPENTQANTNLNNQRTQMTYNNTLSTTSKIARNVPAKAENDDTAIFTGIDEGIDNFEIPTTTLVRIQSKTTEAVSIMKKRIISLGIGEDNGLYNIQEQLSDKEPMESASKSMKGKSKEILNQSKLRLGFDVDMSVGLSSRATSNSQMRKLIYQIENAIQEKPKGHELRILIWLIFVFFLAAIITCIFTNNHAFNLMEDSLNSSRTLRVGALRLFNLLEVGRRTRCGYIVEKGYLPYVRGTIADYSWYCINQSKANTFDLESLNEQVIETYQYFDESLLSRVFKKFPMLPRRDGEPPIEVPAFKSVTEFVNSALNLVKKKINLVPLNPDDEDMMFILKNVYRELLINSEDLLEILHTHIQTLNEKINLQSIIVLVVFSFLSLLLIIISIKIEKEGAILRNKLFASLLKIEEKDYMPYVKNLNTYFNRIKDKQIVETHMLRGGNQNQAKSIAKKNGNQVLRSFRRGNLNGINLKSYKRILLTTVILSPVLLIQGLLLSYMQSYTSESNRQNEMILTSNTMLARYALFFSEIYTAISDNGTSTIRNRPISEEIGKDLKFLQDGQTFFVKLREEYQSNGTMVQLLSGDVCSLLYASVITYQTNWASCSTVSQGIAKRGIIGINSYLADNLMKVKGVFDSSDHSLTAIKQALGLTILRDCENIMGIVFKWPYLFVDSILIDTIQKTNQKYYSITNAIGIILIVVCLILLFFSYKQIYLDAVQERIDTKLILHLIPIRIVFSNAHIKNYLKSVSSTVLSIRN